MQRVTSQQLSNVFSLTGEGCSCVILLLRKYNKMFVFMQTYNIVIVYIFTFFMMFLMIFRKIRLLFAYIKQMRIRIFCRKAIGLASL